MKTNRKQLQVILAGMLLAAGGTAYALGFVRYNFLVGDLKVAIYPAAFLILIGAVQAYRAFFVNAERS